MPTTANKPRKAYAPRGSKTATVQEKKAPYGTYADYLARLASEYGDMPASKVYGALQRTATFQSMYTANPLVQNRRVKQISSLPVDTGKDKIVDMLRSPDSSEQPLRSVGNILEYTCYPMLKMRTVYQDLLTYHWYVAPAYLDEAEATKDEFWREYRLAQKTVEEMQIARLARQIVGLTVRDGKVFMHWRKEIDKAHNHAVSAFVQQLPQDWCKIAGQNNISKYTVAFNMFYFLQPGTSYLQYGDLFKPYIDDFNGIFTEASVTPKGVVMASKNEVNAENLMRLKQNVDMGNVAGSPEIYSQNGSWFYWVYLPAEDVFPFEIDDVKVNVVSPFTGMYLSAAQQAQMEQVQLEIVQNPLVALITGFMETYDSKDVNTADPVKVSPSGRELFIALYEQMMQANNVGGVGIYPAPFRDMHMWQLSESPNANKISSEWNSYLMGKSGLSGIIPTSNEARAGIAQISLKLESRFAQHIYGQIERMVNTIFRKMRLKHEFRFTMFGDVASDSEMLKQAERGMTLGLLPEAMRYAAMQGRSLMDEMSMSYAIKASGLMDYRIPLKSSFGAAVEPQLDEGGRPKAEEVGTEGNEQDVDEGGEDA